ncbi:hypothetical protein BU23DRAFT_659474 [Bimuria novae-zelandiae CBS 107.79]|uniref:Ecp2 effector protein domain-containing protein n=1 Tax=Bimuria novae-zelandiae CBS 107.79 TaxID=1447943 RepID=A0A6A5UTM8_9PLEO|nr:hypothetical protein BU23DRAFT_659474 [Bimuria novae-zelandiae CBS 107.79]
MLFAATVLGLASFTSLAAQATAAPSNPPSMKHIVKRYEKEHYCFDDKWKMFGERAVLYGFRIMGNVDAPGGVPSTITDIMDGNLLTVPGRCSLTWCGGEGDTSAAMYLCQPKKIIKDGSEIDAEKTEVGYKSLAQKYHDGFNDCFGREPEDENIKARAFHVWNEEGWSLHVEGSPAGRFTCDADIGKDIFDFPDDLLKEPYKDTSGNHG